MGVRLFERDRTGYRATSEGGALIEALQPVQDRIEGIARTFSQDDSASEAIVRLAAPAALSQVLIAPRLGQLRMGHAGLSILLHVISGAAPARLGMLDMALTYGRPVAGDMIIRKLADVGYALYAIPELLARHRMVKSGDLTGMPLIGFTGQEPAWPPAQWQAQAERVAQTVFRCDDAESRRAAMEAGVGAAILPCFLAEQKPGVTRLLGPETLGSVELWLAVQKEVRHVSRLREMADFLVDLMKDRQPRLAGIA
jgi:DNA-binding transcriptional LysR family regulator